MTRSLLPDFVQLLRPELFDPTQPDMSIPKFDMGEGTITIGGFGPIENILHEPGKLPPFVIEAFPISFIPKELPTPIFEIVEDFVLVEPPTRWIESSSSIMIDTSADYSVNFEPVSDIPIPGAAIVFLLGMACLSLRRRF